MQEALQQALAVYRDLVELQGTLGDEGQREASKAEAIKLMGNVYVALGDWER